MPEREPKFSSTEIDKAHEEALEMDKEAEEIVEKGEAKAPQEAIERIEEKELKELIDLKAEDAYEKNNVVRFTNAAFLDDVFITQNEFRGATMITLETDEDYQKYYNKKEENYPDLPQGKSGLGILIDKIYRGVKDGLTEKQKNAKWSGYINERTDWYGTGGDYYTEEHRVIRDIKRQSSNRSEFEDQMHEQAMKKLDIIIEFIHPLHISIKDVKKWKTRLKDEKYFRQPNSVREWLHFIGGIQFEKKGRDVGELKYGSKIFRTYNIGLITPLEKVARFGDFGTWSWGRFTDVDIKKDLKGIICTVRDRVFEKKVIEEMIELTKDNPEARAPVFDLDGNQIWPTRRKREEIEEEIKEIRESFKKDKDKKEVNP